TGKLQRIGLAERLGLVGSGVSPPPLEAPARFVAPRTPVEKLLAGLWSQVLGIDPIGVQDHFLRLGGDSLLATRLVARICDLLRVQFSVLALFDEAPTVERMSAALLSDPAERPRVERTAQLWLEVSALSDDEVDVALAAA